VVALQARARAAGLLAVAVGVAAEELLHAVSRPVPSLLHVVDQAVVRAAPGGFSRRAIETVGTADKPLLRLGSFVVLAAIALWLGPASSRRPWVGYAVFATLGGLAVGSAASLDGVSIVATLVGCLVAAAAGLASLRGLLSLAVDRDPVPSKPEHMSSRRRFLLVGSAAAGGATLAFVGAPSVRRRLFERQRDGVRLPAPSEAAPGAGPDLPTPGISSLVTPNARFYRIDEAITVPSVDLGHWRLRVTGLVAHPLELDYEALLAEPLVERWITLACVSNDVGGPLVGNARWIGVRLASLLERAGVLPTATQVVGRSVDGFTTAFPVAVALDGRDPLIAVGMNGVPLPNPHGFPARLVVPGLFGFVSATKWLSEVRLTTSDFDPYWVRRGWARQGPITVQSRIDTPRDFAHLRAGPVPTGGVAWAPTHGVGRVELRVDGGPWSPAALGSPLGDDAWRQWQLRLYLPAGRHEIEVRATTRDGMVQVEEQRSSFPSGATGFHRVTVRCT
jgi:DMSO/TMAO reductase YedYZ molybdopterin-dependent catalytic subunit